MQNLFVVGLWPDMVFHGALLPEERKREWELSDRKDIRYTETDSVFRIL
jgi:hypothetical protein